MTPEVHSFTRLLGRVHTDPDVAELNRPGFRGGSFT